MDISWKSVMPATLTQFNADLTIDHGLMAEHGRWLVENGCTAIVPHGSLGEGATLSFAEKTALQKNCVEALPETPIIPGIAPPDTRRADTKGRPLTDYNSEKCGAVSPSLTEPYFSLSHMQCDGVHLRILTV